MMKVGENPVRTTVSATWLILFLTTVLAIMDYLGIFILGLFSLYISLEIMGVVEARSSKIQLYFFGVFFSILGTTSALPIVTYLYVTREKTGFKRFCKKYFDDAFSVLDKAFLEIDLPILHPILGSNSFQEWWNDIGTYLNEASSYWVGGMKTSASYLRDLGIDETPIDYRTKEHFSSSEVWDRYVYVLNNTRAVMTVICAILLLTLTGPAGLLLMGIAVGVPFLADDDDRAIIDSKQKGPKIRDGIYRVDRHLFGISIDKGIGTVCSGILHVPYHVTKANSVLIGRTRFYPYYISVNEDLVTYGGPPCFAMPRDEDKVYVNCETDESRTSYLVDLDKDLRRRIVAWPSVTKPGESGSPVWSVTDDGSMKLVGLAGRYIRQSDDHITEFAKMPYVAPAIEAFSNLKRIITHPGSGKTRVQIPQLLMDFLPRSKKRILVTGPTRVVCMEMYDRLRKEFRVGLNIKGETTRKDSFAQIQIMAHRTALQMLTKGNRIISNLGMIIIDEAHCDDTATILMRKFGKNLAESGIEVVEMSATLDGEYNAGSNYDITDWKRPLSEFKDLISEDLVNGKRVCVFVTSLNSQFAKTLVKVFREWNPVQLSRKTFEAAMPGVKDLNRKLIITTDIAECGINIPELESVYDVSEKFNYIYDAGVIHGSVIGISRASWVQRRGRVGRTQPGKYVATREPRDVNIVSAAQVEADILATGRAWAADSTNNHGIKLSDKQFEAWLDADESPVYVYWFTDQLGMKLSKGARMAKWENEIRGHGDVHYIGCESQCGKCEGNYPFYDERLHEKLFNIKVVEDII